MVVNRLGMRPLLLCLLLGLGGVACSSPPAPAASGCFVELSALAYGNGAACTACQKSSCDSQFTMAWGSGWKTGDYCSGGSCGAFMKCMNGCKGVASCEDGCKPLADAPCMTSVNDTNTCSDANCKPQCNP
jgi:hypothetical protein